VSLIVSSALRTIPGALVLSLLAVAAVAAQAAGAASPSAAVRTLVQSLATANTPATGCNTLRGQVDDCPITARLRTRLQSPIPGVETGNLISRSQNPPSTLDVAEVKLAEGATVAQVNTRWQYGPSDNAVEYTITFVARKEAGGWLVDDAYCQNDLSTSIYNAPTGPCPTTSAPGVPVPGMPSTGAPADPDYLLPLALAGAALLLGGLLAGRGARAAR
jgi:hypothetical protein